MQLFDPNNPSEKKKMIAAAVLGVVAIAFLGYVFFGPSGSSKKPTTNRNVASTPSPATVANTRNKLAANDIALDGAANLEPLPPSLPSAPAVPEPNRNIFAY